MDLRERENQPPLTMAQGGHSQIIKPNFRKRWQSQEWYWKNVSPRVREFTPNTHSQGKMRPARGPAGTGRSTLVCVDLATDCGMDSGK